MNKLHLYTGDGKGKTTAAMGLALRSLGHGRSVVVAQFMKDGRSGELTALRNIPGATVLPAPPIRKFTFRMTEEELAQTAREQTSHALFILRGLPEWKPEMIILDELAVAIDRSMVDEATARELIAACLTWGETVVTGRMAPPWLIAQADYISRVQAERHPYDTEGLAARKGIEW